MGGAHLRLPAERTGLTWELSAALTRPGFVPLCKQEARHQTFATDHQRGRIAHLDGRHRRRARVEPKVRDQKASGIGLLPSRELKLPGTWPWATAAILAFERILVRQPTRSPDRNRPRTGINTTPRTQDQPDVAVKRRGGACTAGKLLPPSR
ncbi:hypothetical protein F0344_15360 [Streptomyces finlayi]|uniref:Transposase n=1 Tax=Streptomyces finlayi TaxID=67296 RepID=A0A7G7BKG1_9ACTN|nr:hypothetical protein [Streptomyces finlayi]QNE75826.1 hypothetical protein F0344_15360 [Streptomyces finlayi]